MAEDAPIGKEIFINAPPELVFPFLVNAERMVEWMGATAQLDARPGGVFHVDISEKNIAHGEFVEVVPNERVVFTWGWQGGHEYGPGSTTVEITLQERDGGTFVRLQHSGLAGEGRTQHSQGWEYFLARLQAVGEGRVPV